MIKSIVIGGLAIALATGSVDGLAQSLDDLNIQVHGYATQGFLYTTQNNLLTTRSSDGSPAWTEAVVNITAQPIRKLRFAVQGHYFLLGNLGNSIALDSALADYKWDDRFGVRFGKVKTPLGLFNEMQDIDPGYMWALLPQSVYPIQSRNTLLSHYGAVVYGILPLGQRLGKMEYRGWAGERVLLNNDGYLLSQTQHGITLPNGLSGVTYGGALRWRTPLPGLLVGMSDYRNNNWSAVLSAAGGQLAGIELIHPFNSQNVFVQYERNKWMAAAEYSRLPVSLSVNLDGMPPGPLRIDYRSWYAMASYKATSKLTVGAYDSQFVDHQSALGPVRFSKDWTVSARYDFNPFIYAKAEQHFIDGTAVGYDMNMNQNGLKPDTKLSILKVGVSF